MVCAWVKSNVSCVAGAGIFQFLDLESKNSRRFAGLPAWLGNSGSAKLKSHWGDANLFKTPPPCQITSLAPWAPTQGCQKVFLGCCKTASAWNPWFFLSVVDPVRQVCVMFNPWHPQDAIVKVYQCYDHKERHLYFTINSQVIWVVVSLCGSIQSIDHRGYGWHGSEKLSLLLCGKPVTEGLGVTAWVNGHGFHNGEGRRCVRGGLGYRHRYPDKKTKIICIVYQKFTGTYTKNLPTAWVGYIIQSWASKFLDWSGLLGFSVLFLVLVSIFPNLSSGSVMFTKLDVFLWSLERWALSGILSFPLVFEFSGNSRNVYPYLPPRKYSPACIIFILFPFVRCANVTDISI